MLTSYPMRISQRRLRTEHLRRLSETHTISTSPVPAEQLKDFTLSSLVLLGDDLKDAVQRYVYALEHDSPALAQQSLAEVERLLIDQYAHVCAYFENTELPAFSRFVNRACTDGTLSTERVTSIKEIRRVS